jgi:NTF2 fold immunity protein
MSTPNTGSPDYSMLSRRRNGQELVSAETAVAIARFVHKEQYGQEVLEKDEPLLVRDDGSCWIIMGSKRGEYDPKKQLLDGPLEMRISKFDGQILSYVFSVSLPRPASDRPASDSDGPTGEE